MFPSELVLAATAAFVFCLPPELLIMIAACLDRNSLLSALLVSRSWNETLRHVIWFVVKELDWHHPSHPFHGVPLLEMEPFFIQTRVMSWYSNNALTLTYASSSTEQVLMPQIRRAGLTSVFALMHNLTSVELHMDSFPTMSDFALLPQLGDVHLDFVSIIIPHNHVHIFPVPAFAELFTNIGTFKLVLPERTRSLAVDNDGAAVPWAITDLDVEPESIPLASGCQGLRKIAISSDRDFSPVSLRPLLRCARLGTLRVNISLGSFMDHIDVVPQLRQLTFLDIVVGSPSDIEFLKADGSGLGVSLPLLDSIKFRHTQYRAHADSVRLDKVYGSILRYRANLRMFSVVGGDIDPFWIFDELRADDDDEGWVCLDLESLDMTLAWPQCSRTSEQKTRQWEMVFRQIGRLSQLLHLSVSSKDFSAYPASAFLKECDGLSELYTLVLSAPDTNHAWRVPQLDSLLHNCPWLANLDLGGQTRDSIAAIQGWLEGCERNINLSFFCEDEEEEGDESEDGEEVDEEGYGEYEDYEKDDDDDDDY
ncbi:hypothetical protein BGZ49_004538 [Haplosporangium sp. Z 27]|nr:hypothetical protein BGZ49_004538 [Haplosporangium sp. Z 27]